MKELKSTTGGRYLFFEDLEDLQNSALASAAAIFFGKGNFVISGCQVDGNSISAGFVYLDGKIREVPATSNLSFPVYIVPKNTTEQGMYLDSAALQDTAINYGVQFTTSYNANGIQVKSTGPVSTLEQVLFSNLDINGKISLTDLDVSNVIKMKSQTTASNIGQIHYDDDGFHLSTGIVTGTGKFSGDVSAAGITGSGLLIKYALQTAESQIGMQIGYNFIKHIAKADGSKTCTMSFTEYGTTFDKKINVTDMITLKDTDNASHNIILGPHGLHYSYTDRQILQWGDSDNTTSFLRTEKEFTVAGINGDGAIINVQKQTARANEPTYKTVITESSIMSYSPATQDYQNNRAGFDFLDGNAKLYIHGHMYNVGVSAKGFLYDQNNPEFVDPIAGGSGSGSGGSIEEVTVATLNDVSVINWKKVDGDSTYTGKLSIGAASDGLIYDGNMKLGGSLKVTGSIVANASVTAKDVYCETIRVKNDSAYVQGKSGVTTIYNYTNLRFEISQGSTQSSRIVKLMGDKLTCTYIGGILTSTVMNAGEILSGFTTPHPVSLIDQ